MNLTPDGSYRGSGGTHSYLDRLQAVLGHVDCLYLFLTTKASQAQILLKLRLSHAMPSLFTGIRISSGIAVIGAITAELLAGSVRVGVGGIGYAIQYASAQLETDYLFALVAPATALGFTSFFAVMFLECYFLHRWHESALPHEQD